MPVVMKTMSKDKPSSTWLSRCGLLCQGRQSVKRVKGRILLWAVMLRMEANGVVTSTAKVRPRHLELLKCRSVLDSVMPCTDHKHPSGCY